MRNFFIYSAPIELRSKLNSVLPETEFKFPSVTTPLAANTHRILSGQNNAIAFWRDYVVPGLDQFLEKRKVPVFRLDPIHGFGERQEEPPIIGVRLSPFPHVSAQDPAVADKEFLPADIRAASAFAALVGGEKTPLRQLIPPGAKPQALVAPQEGWLKALSAAARDAFVLVLAQEFPDHDLILLSDEGLNYFDHLQEGRLAAVVYSPFHRSWSKEIPLVITNDPGVASLRRLKGAPVRSDLDVPGWAQPDFAAAEEAPLDAEDFKDESVDPSVYLAQCYYFPPEAESLGAQEGAEGGEPRFAGLHAALAQAPQEASLFRIARAIPEDEVVSPEKPVVHILTERHEVAIFDDRTRDCEITSILPFRYAPERRDAIERLRHVRMDARLTDEISFFLVDDGSDPEVAPQLREICAELGFSYLRLETSDQPFSVGRCRNLGAEYARSRFIFMQDIDLMPYDGFYQDLLNEIDVQEMRDDARHFLMIPYIFLTQRGTEFFQRLDPRLRRQRLIQAALVNDATLIEKFSTGTSANLYDRQWYLARGGNSRDFVGWGYEDIEFNTRMIWRLGYFPTPEEWSLEKFNFNSVTEYRSYKAVYRLFGDLAMMKGIALFHAWHPKAENSEYARLAEVNREIFIRKLQNFPTTQEEPSPLPDRSRGRTLVFRKNAFTVSRTAAPAFGELLQLEDETALPNRASLQSFVSHHGITRILFFNPYQTPQMRRLQKWAGELGIPFLIGERGALPGSSFYDPSGFLADSAAYAPAAWDHPLSKAEERRTTGFLRDLQSAKPALETQEAPVGGAALRRQLGLSEDETAIFVPLQRPGDTATRFFPRDVSYLEFEAQVMDLASRDLPGLRLVIKTHPLEEPGRSWGNAILANDANVYDLLEACDLVWTFNSGAGVLAMAWSRFCAFSGKAFYAVEGANAPVSGPDEVVALARNPPPFDRERSLRFLHHLSQRVYSFGEHVTQPVRMADGARMTATTDIEYEVLRLEGREFRFKPRKQPAVGKASILFDRYRHAMQNPPRDSSGG